MSASIVTEAILVARDLTKTYRIARKRAEVIKHLDLEVKPGEFLTIVGPSGCGKSTLLHLLAGFDLPDSGDITIAGQLITAMDEDRRTIFRREHIGFVFQFFNLIPSLTLAENVALPLTLSGHGRREVFPMVGEMMERLSLSQMQGRRPEEISGGEQQRIAIARALMIKPSIVMADEPTGNLDFTTSGSVIQMLLEVSRSGQTVIMATHDARAAAFGDRTLVMRDGSIIDELVWGQRQGHASGPLIERLVSLGM